MKKYIAVLLPIFLCILTLLPLNSFFTPGLPVTHDGRDHVVRIASFYTSLQEGTVIPRWAGNLNWGYGHPILMFLYPFSSYSASLLHFIGFSLVDATKAVFMLGFIGSILSMYVWMQAVWGKRIGFIGALLYGFAPYRFVDLYVRGAIGEHMAFIFPPLIMYFLYILAKNRILRFTYIKIIGLSLSFAFFILSHNAISLMFMPVFGLYFLYLFFSEADKSWKYICFCLVSIALGFGLSSFFWIPAFFEGKYTLRDIVTAGEVMTRFVPFNWFLYSPWNYGGTGTLTKSVGFVQWIGICASCIFLLKLKDVSKKIFLATSLILFVFSLFIMTSASEGIWSRLTILQNFQFPWRFLSITVFLAAVIGGISINRVIRFFEQKVHMKRKTYVLFMAFFVLLGVSTYHMWHPSAYSLDSESSYKGIYPGTTDTGESSPIWSVRFMEHTPSNPMEVIDGEALISLKDRTSTVHEYTIAAQKQTRVVENTLYFPGWKIYVDGLSAGIQFQDPQYRGLMTFWVDEGEHDVKVIFTDTKIRYWANRISTVSLGCVIALGIIVLICKRKK